MKKMFRMILAQAVASSLAFAAAADSSKADPRDSASPYGVLAFLDWDHDWNGNYSGGDKLAKSAAQIQGAGIVWVRTVFDWTDIEPEPGHYDFSKYEKLLDTLERHQLKTLAVLAYNPGWKQGEWNSAPDKKEYLAYSRAVVSHFKDRVKYWEIWNEPAESDYWRPQDGLVAYCQLLKDVTPIIKEEDPTAKVVMGALDHKIPSLLRLVYQRSGKNSFDVVNIHPFMNPRKHNALTRLHRIHASVMRVMSAFGDQDKPIWITEIGCPGVARSDPANRWWLGQASTEAQQAEWLITVYTNALKWKGVDKIYWAFYRDIEYFHNSQDEFGLVRLNFSERPAYSAYKSLTNLPTKGAP